MASGSPQEWSDILARDGRLEVSLGKRRLVLLLALSVVFVVLGVWIWVGAGSSTDRVLSAVTVVCFGAGVFIFARGLVRSGAAVVVDGQGISAAQPGLFVPWASALGTSVFSTRGTHLVQVEADKPVIDAFYAAHRGLALLRGANRRLTGGRESLSLPSPLEVDAYGFALWLDTEIRKRNPALR